MGFSPRTILVLVVITAVILGLGGLVVASQIANAGATRPIWVVSQPIAAGDTFTSSNVQQIKVSAKDQFAAYSGDPTVGTTPKRAAISLGVGHPLTNEDVITVNLSEVSLNLKGAPPLGASDSIDVYVQFNGNSVFIGRHLIVRSATPVTVLVPTASEPYWIALQATGEALYAAKSNGVGVPTSTLTAADAINALNLGQQAVASPSPTAGGSATPSPSPSPTR